jgi:hypothetical protein
MYGSEFVKIKDYQNRVIHKIVYTHKRECFYELSVAQMSQIRLIGTAISRNIVIDKMYLLCFVIVCKQYKKM